MKFHCLDGDRGTWRRPSAHRGCVGSMLRNGSYIGGCKQRLILQEFRQHVDCDWGTQWRTSVCPGFGGSTLRRQATHVSDGVVGDCGGNVTTSLVTPEMPQLVHHKSFGEALRMHSDGPRPSCSSPSSP